MANMSYCRFTNTVQDLQDCYDNWQDDDEMSDREKEARRRLYELCQQIINTFDGEE